ncbi:hypothetical protein SERLADRAFT_454156 [Serpula lacrymans var. lacrymans S7.9]|uniref:SET domain-containing protein n=1 Tax=Serpula lacrymans var. lacrymans (strain S7.9) TaxID=578457 RepID=F8PDY5_SERL9|nr:uncharacterized protein SERLADRAFT_454156 [Serpula lacrymans var. lacrymans S7.9]EGO18582.1 hypothetical protein SERLADRAFT_454156 [Serpula lacrymans var. lacrymans S7.9]
MQRHPLDNNAANTWDNLPSSLLFTIPANALLNIRTLKPHYPARHFAKLTAVQLISLHLMLHRPHGGQDSLDPLFGPYISVLPHDFSGHPLSWKTKVEKHPGSSKKEEELLHKLPPNVDFALEKLSTRFWEDWNIVSTLMLLLNSVQQDPSFQKARNSDSLSHISDALTNFLWAWLNVNTRSVYHRLKSSKSDPDNLTMCPILDFANHTADLPHMTLVPTQAEIWNTIPKKMHGEDLAFLSPSDAILSAGEELYLTYGAHSNRTLFVEYGFVIDIIDDDKFHGEIDVQDVLEGVLQVTPSDYLVTKNILEEEGYWGDWTLHCSPTYVYPSYRLISALRLHHLISTRNKENLLHDEVLQPWRDVISGRRDIISEDNEVGWRQTLVDICTAIIKRAKNVFENNTVSSIDVEGCPWFSYMDKSIMMLWREELLVARSVRQSVLQGREF